MLVLIGVIGVVVSIAVKLVFVQIGGHCRVDEQED